MPLMIRKTFCQRWHTVLLLLFSVFVSVFAQENDAESGAPSVTKAESGASVSAQAGDTKGSMDAVTATGKGTVETAAEHTMPVPANIANNDYLKEAWRFSNLARLAIQEGEYDASTEYSAEATRYAALSDEYIRNLMRLIPALSEAEDRLRWAERSGAAEYYPKELDTARADLQTAYAERRARNWDESYRYALLVIEDLRGVAAPPPKDAPPSADLPQSPNQYKVRPWDIFGDCFWNIAQWFYGDPWKWPLVYEANKDKLPEPDNPDWVEVGTILDLPSADGELREGYWDSGRPYTAPVP